MADESKTKDTIPAKAEVSTTAPAVHSDRMWEGPRVFDQGDGVPTQIETKTEFRDYLNKHGLRMKDQQESTTGPTRERANIPAEFSLVVVEPLTMREAHAIGAMKAVLKRHGLSEALWCDDCFSRKRPHGCRTIVNDAEVVIGCRCGVAKYRAPMGTTDLLAPLVTPNDASVGTIETSDGQKFVPTLMLTDDEAYRIQAWMIVLRQRNKEPWLFHSGCYAGNPYDEDNSAALKVTRHEVIIACGCRQLFWRGTPNSSVH